MDVSAVAEGGNNGWLRLVREPRWRGLSVIPDRHVPQRDRAQRRRGHAPQHRGGLRRHSGRGAVGVHRGVADDSRRGHARGLPGRPPGAPGVLYRRHGAVRGRVGDGRLGAVARKPDRRAPAARRGDGHRGSQRHRHRRHPLPGSRARQGARARVRHGRIQRAGGARRRRRHRRGRRLALGLPRNRSAGGHRSHRSLAGAGSRPAARSRGWAVSLRLVRVKRHRGHRRSRSCWA